jgi:hypothetical protein
MMKNCLVLVAALMLSACNAEPQDLVAMKIELHAIKQEMEYLRQQTEELDPRVRSAEQMALQVMDERAAPSRLDCIDHKPGILVTPVATLTTVCEAAVPYADGIRIKLRLGNPTAGRIDGLKLTFYAGDGASQGRSDMRRYYEDTTSVPPGSWKLVDVDLYKISEAALRELALRAQIDTIALVQK